MAPITGIGDTIGDIWDTITGPASSIADGVAFASDPLGWTFGKVQDSLDGLVTRLLPWLMNATKPDLTADWFTKVYALSFGIAILVWLLIVLGRVVAVSRGTASGHDLIELFTTRSLTFIGGATWGPAVGWVIVGIFHALSEGILATFSQTTEGALSALRDIITKADWLAIPGGILFATGLLVCMLISLTLVVIMMIIAMVALYLSGVIFPLGWVWITDDPARRPIAYKLAWTWLGLNAAHPLLFLMLAASFSYIAWMVPASTDVGIAVVTNAITAIIVMCIVAASPVLLFRFAPVLPTTAGQSVPTFSGGGGGQDNGYNSNDLSKVADNQTPQGSAETAESGTGSTGGGGGGDSAPGPLESAAMNAPASPGGAGAGASKAAGQGASEAGEQAADQASADAPGAGDGPAEGSSAPMGASSTGEAADTAAAGAETGEAAEGVAAAGAAESSTGVGAVIGIPTLIAAAGMAAADKAVGAATSAGEMAASDMDDQGGAR